MVWSLFQDQWKIIERVSDDISIIKIVYKYNNKIIIHNRIYFEHHLRQASAFVASLDHFYQLKPVFTKIIDSMIMRVTRIYLLY